jgi:MFS transporter, Spinster family, sphingosine-1-phosphate transporter
MRAIAIAAVYLFANLIGIGLGPWAGGALSDALRPLAGEESLRYAMLILSPGILWGAWHLWAAGRTVMADVERSSRDSEFATDVMPVPSSAG